MPDDRDVLTRDHPDAFEPLPDRFFCHRLVANKPDPAVFRQVSDLLATPPATIRFVDDSADNVDAARGCGWHAVTYAGPSDIADLLRR